MSARLWCAAVAAAGVMAAAACDRDSRVERRPAPVAGARPQVVTQIPLVPGEPVARTPVRNPFDGNAGALEEGARLYDWFNCSGCHFAGGGGIGPPLMDEDWIYGGDPDQIFDSIASGRANGMPAYGVRLASDEIWKIVAYVQTLGDDAERPARGLGRSPTGNEP